MHKKKAIKVISVNVGIEKVFEFNMTVIKLNEIKQNNRKIWHDKETQMTRCMVNRMSNNW